MLRASSLLELGITQLQKILSWSYWGRTRCLQSHMDYQIDVLFSLVIWVQKYRQSMHRPNNQRLSSWATNYTWARLSMNSYYSSSCGKQFLDHKSINRDFQKKHEGCWWFDWWLRLLPARSCEFARGVTWTQIRILNKVIITSRISIRISLLKDVCDSTSTCCLQGHVSSQEESRGRNMTS